MTVHRLVLATDVYVPPERCFEFLLDFPGYTKYTDVLRDVRRVGDGAAGTEYHLDVSWWRISRTVRSEVLEVDAPRRIEWRLLDDLAVCGHWEIDSLATDGAENPASRVRLTATFDPEASHVGSIGTSALLASDRVRASLAGRLRDDAEALLERIVADLEGEARPVELQVLEAPGGLAADD